jgi:hypothetical protein
MNLMVILSTSLKAEKGAAIAQAAKKSEAKGLAGKPVKSDVPHLSHTTTTPPTDACPV